MTTATPPTEVDPNVSVADRQHTVDVHIAVTVLEAARVRADSQGHPLRAVARLLFFAAAEAAEPAGEVPEGSRPPLREYGVPRKKLRFTVPLGAFLPAADAIQASNRTIASVIETGLVHYARTGSLCAPPPDAELDDPTEQPEPPTD